MTLIELLVVLLVVAAFAGMVVPLFGGISLQAPRQVTEASLVRLRSAILGEEGQPGYLQDMGQLPATIEDLFIKPPGAPAHFDPVSRRGWRGPYIRARMVQEAEPSSDFAERGTPAVLDGWGRPIVLQLPSGDPLDVDARLVSAGPNGTLEVDPSALSPGLDERGDDLVLYLLRADIP